MTYENAEEVRQVAIAHGFETQTVGIEPVAIPVWL